MPRPTQELQFWSRATVAAAMGVMLFSLGLMVWPRPSVAFFNLILYRSLDYPPHAQGGAAAYLTFVYGVLGAVIVGWMSLVALLARSVARTASRSVATALVVSTLVWFAVDGALSLALGYWPNAVTNAVFLGVLLVPMAGLRRWCREP
jgi:hypothetical protein